MNSPQLDPGDKFNQLLDAVARITRGVTSILDTDLLLRRTVQTICTEFGFSSTGVFLLDETGQQAVLRAAPDLTHVGHQLPVDGDSLVSAAIKQRQVQIAPDADEQTLPGITGLPETGSAMALPLAISDEVIGALLVQSDTETTFAQVEIATLQIIADQLAIAINNSRLHHQIQDLLYQSVRRSRLLAAASAVGHGVATILDLDELLPTTVDTICETYGFYYAGVFLLDESGEALASLRREPSSRSQAEGHSVEPWAILRAGRGQAGAAMIAAGYKLAIDNHSMVGAAINTRRAQITSAVEQQATFGKNLHLPDTRSEMALPLTVEDKVLGAVTVQSTDERAFSPDDVTSLQTMVDYMAIAIHNAQVLQELEQANAELARSKTFEMIATATGEAIHWVGNKAAPIPASVARTVEDLVRYMSMVDTLLAKAPPQLRQHKFALMLADAAQAIAKSGHDLTEIQAELERLPLKRLRRVLSIESIFEDLDIIQSGANAILNIKEDLVGPARRSNVELIHLPEFLKDIVVARGIPPEVVRTAFAADLPPVRADRRQLDRVFVNLIKNALEAMEAVAEKKLFLWARPAIQPGMVEIDVTDNGVGISPDRIDKIWVAFYTTKGDRGGTGLGLPACLEIVKQAGGKIRVDSEPDEGTTFTVSLPAARYHSPIHYLPDAKET